jgi:hypothetical protein
MPFAAFSGQAQDLSGNAVKGVKVEVRREAPGQPLASIYSDRSGAAVLGNPFTTNPDDNGLFRFHAAGGAYRVRLFTDAGFEAIRRYVAIGLGGESDMMGAFNVRDELANPALLPTEANPGDAYLIPNDATPPVKELWVWLSATEGWVNLGSVTGVKGDRGDPGPPGEQGQPGLQGAPGLSPGLFFFFDSATATNADPGAGDVRLNNAVLSAVTQIAIDDQSARGGNPSVAAAIATWGNSTNTTGKGTLRLTKFAAPENFAEYVLTAVIPQVGYRQLAVTHVASAGAFVAGDALAVEFVRTGDKGADGIGAGDVLGPNGGVADGEIPVFDGTTGKAIRGGGSSIAALTNLILSTVRNGVSAAFDTLAELADGLALKLDAALYTAGDVRAKLLTVDGAGSGVDADLLDGQQATAFEPADGNIVKGNATKNLTAGYTATSNNLGNTGSATQQLSFAGGNLVRYVNTQAHSLVPPAAGEGSMIVQITNGTGAGAITTTAFTRRTGDNFTTTVGHNFLCFLSRVNGFTHIHVQALQ